MKTQHLTRFGSLVAGAIQHACNTTTLVFVLVMVLGLNANLARAQNKNELNVLINEGVSYRTSEAEVKERYKPIALDLARLLRMPVNIVLENDYKKIATGLAAQLYDVAYVHPAHLSIVALRNKQYSLLALTKGYTDYRASFLVSANSPIQSLADFKNPAHKNKEIIAPAQDSITSFIARATLKEALGVLPLMTYTQFQDAVTFSLEHGIAAVGVTASPDVVKAWQAKGGKVINVSKPVPIKHLLASNTVSEAQRRAIADYFIALSTTDLGRKKLSAMTIEGFVPFDDKALIAIGQWLGL